MRAADAGSGGQWLLDPVDLTVDAVAAATISNSYATGSVGGHNSGGLVGVSYGTLSNVYALGKASGSGSSGGLLAVSSISGTITNGYWDTDVTATAGWNSGAGLVPRGTDGAGDPLNGGNGFAGIFDRLGHRISDLTINRPAADFVGLLGYATATLRNIGIVGGSVAGGNYTGDLAGQGQDVSNAYATGSVSGNDQVGGLERHPSRQDRPDRGRPAPQGQSARGHGRQ
ncbi:hypothetical protein [Acidimangrovimonas pyrenivorans]